jgi:hypothetical protein
MALNTTYFPGDSPTNILAKLLILFGGSPTAGDGTPELYRKLLQTANGASAGLEVPSNFKDSADDADAIIYSTGGTVEVLRVVGATGFLQSKASRFHRDVDDEFLTVLGGTSKATSGFYEVYGQDHPTGLGGITCSIHDGGNFRVRSAPNDSTTSVLKFQVTGGEGDLEHTPKWNDAGTVFTAIKSNVTNTASDADSLLLDLQIAAASKFNVDINGDATSARNYIVGQGDASNYWFGTNDFNKFLPSNNGGNTGVMGAASFYIQIDSNNDQADRVFAVYKDSQFAGGGTELLTVSETGAMNVTGDVSRSGTQILTTRQTGWTAPSGTESRATFDTATVTTEELAKRVYALYTDLAAHGLIGS